MNKIRVMRIIARLNIGGPALQAILLNSQLDKRVYETILVTGVESKHEGKMLDLSADHKVYPIVIPFLGREIGFFRDIFAFIWVLRLIKKEKPYIVHTHTAKAGMIGRLAAWVARVPVIIHTFHGHIFHGYFGPLRTRFFIVVERALARLSDRLVTVSPRLKEELVGYGIAKPDKIEIIPLGFNLKPFYEDRRDVFRRELSLGNDIKLVGIVGRLTKIKNHRFFLRVAAKVAGSFPSVKFVVVGDGELRQELERTSAELGLSEKVFFVGWQSDMPKVYASLDIMILTSLNEGTPVTLIEAMASGCPVVATNVGGVSDLITSGENGFIVNNFDVEEFSSSILSLLHDPILAKRMGEVGRLRVKEQFTEERLLNDISRLYLNVLKQKRISIQ